MRKTLSQTILAAFCAILCATSMGGGGMNIGARTACWAGKSLPYKYEVEYLESGEDCSILVPFDFSVKNWTAYVGVGKTKSMYGIWGYEGLLTTWRDASGYDAGFGFNNNALVFGCNNRNTMTIIDISKTKNYTKYEAMLHQEDGYLTGTSEGVSLTRVANCNQNTPYAKVFEKDWRRDTPAGAGFLSYYIKLFDGDEMKFDLVPVVAMFDGVDEACFYNRVDGSFLRNRLSGQIIAGPRV